jgi:flagellar motility protein MotE (MotC chaperone)
MAALQIAAVFLALNFLALVTVVVGQYTTGRLSARELLNVVRVLAGYRVTSLTKAEVAEYRRLLREREERLQTEAEEKGTTPVRYESAEALETRMAMLRENADVLRGLIAKEQEKLETLRARIESTKEELATEREMLAVLKNQQTTVALSENAEETRQVLTALEAEVTAEYLGTLVQRRDTDEAARILREHLPPDQAAEVLTEMEAPARQQILPLLENKYADLSPEAIVQRWTNVENPTPTQIAEYLRRMTVRQAFGVYLQLDPARRNEVAQILQ